ncbi:TetR family transcriptional regulator [Pseudoduganella sp. FT26W]|uniref:TetR family transcriptional regulator n=1 Tax=Duganella aquatilis TaxID=2666082 RepID=A0A844CVU4_9BURK|nr:TetR/AcrR family transcriptional regulator [Duganella aquatilis]MRW84483.1 TetR family transcriptional regulator [Duganella aquatilis]
MSSDTANRILDTAQHLIVTRGYNAFSYADIAEVVSISKPSIHFHFATKAELVRQLLLRYRETVQVNLAQLAVQVPDPVAQLRAYAGHWEKCIRDDTAPFCLCAMLASELLSLPSDVAVEVKLYFGDLADWLTHTLEKGAAQGQLVLPRGAAVEAESFMASAHGAMLSARVFGDADVFVRIVGEAIDRLLVK